MEIHTFAQMPLLILFPGQAAASLGFSGLDLAEALLLSFFALLACPAKPFLICHADSPTGGF